MGAELDEETEAAIGLPFPVLFFKKYTKGVGSSA